MHARAAAVDAGAAHAQGVETASVEAVLAAFDGRGGRQASQRLRPHPRRPRRQLNKARRPHLEPMSTYRARLKARVGARHDRLRRCDSASAMAAEAMLPLTSTRPPAERAAVP